MAHKLLSDALIDETFKVFDENIWKVSGDADADSVGQNLTLTNPEADSFGRLTYRDGLNDTDVWYMTVNFELEGGTSDPAEAFGIWFYADCDSVGYQPCDGYGVEFDHKNDIIKFVEVSGGSRVVLASSSTTIKDGINGEEVNNISVQWANGSLNVNINRKPVIEYTFDFDELNVDKRGLMFSAKTGSTDYVKHSVDDIRMVVPSDIIFRNAVDAFDNNGIYKGPNSNTRRIMRTLLGGIESLAVDTQDIHDAHHIKTAHGRQLDRIGRIVNVIRNTGENDEKYRFRIILAFRLNSSTATFDELAQFMGVLLDTDPENLEYEFSPDKAPATMTIRGQQEIFGGSVLSEKEIVDFASQTIEGGHRVQLQQLGTFVLIGDSDPVNDIETGLTADGNLDTGGTLSGDVNA